MDYREIVTVIVVLASVFAYVNHRWIKWPPTIGIMALALFCSLLIASFGNIFPEFFAKAKLFSASVNLGDLLLNFMLSFLLFAGSIHINAGQLRKELWPVVILSTIGTLVSTGLIGVGTFYLFGLFHFHIPLIYCLLFGALISPTDPVAVLAILRQAKIPASLELKISGESLFNDGVGVVIFVTIAEVARHSGANISVFSIGKLFLQEAVGGLLFGALIGYISYLAIRTIDDYKVEVLITLATVLGGYLVADHLHVSGPLAMIIAGLITGNRVRTEAMSAVSRDYLEKFWELIDEILNAVLFLLIGLKILSIHVDPLVLLIGLITIALVLAVRWISVYLPLLALRFRIKFEKHAVTILTWGGLRGGISVALALSLTKQMYHDEFVLLTYLVVTFSILVQGISIGPLARRLQKR